jgi:hypothetical protein
MPKNSLQIFTEETSAAWGPLTSELVAGSCARIEALLKASPSEPWLASLQRELPEKSELYRDPAHGFLLLAHAEEPGRFRPPHDHGRGWVIYGVQQGEMEIKTYGRIHEPDGQMRLVLREAYLVRPGEARVYLPGDIHDTRCTRGPVLYYRFADRDLKKEESEGHAMTRYVERDGVWRVSP